MKNKNVRISTLITTILASASVLAEIPVAVTVIDGDAIEAVDYDDERIIITGSRTNRADLTTRSPIVLRGLDRTNRPIVLVNGIQTELRPAMTPATIDLTLTSSALFERVEVVTGGAAALYGSEAAGGIVDFVLKNDFESFDVGGSYMLYGVQEMLEDYLFTVESKNQCDASHGSPQHGWTLQNKWDFGLQDFNLRGDFMTWGDKSDGYRPGSLSTFSIRYGPNELRSDASQFLGTHDESLVLIDYTYDEFQTLIDRIYARPGALEQDQRNYIAFLGLSAAFGGAFKALSDSAYVLGQFKPDELYDDFVNWSANRTDEDRQRFREGFSFSGPIIDEPGAEEGAGDPAAPANGDTTSAPTPPNPFDRYPYPPDYSFDFSLCNEEQEEEIRKLIRQRDQARADWGYYADFMRGYPFTSRAEQDRIEDERNAAEAIKTRDDNNEALRVFWESCVNPGAATQSAQPTATAPVGLDSGDDDFDIRIGARYDVGEDFSVELHAYKYVNGTDGDKTRVPAAGLGFGVYPDAYGEIFGLPWSENGIRDEVTGFRAPTKRSFTNEDGIARILDFIKLFAWSRDAIMGRTDEDDVSASDGNQRPNSGNRVPLERCAYDLPNEEWQLFLDLDFDSKRCGLTIGFNYEHVPKHQVFQEFGGYGPQGNATGGQTQDPWLQTPEFLKDYTTRRFSFNTNYYNIYTVPEIVDFDFNALNGVANQTFWGNDTCGDAALPAEGIDYLSPGTSSIESVDDQWALEHVGLDGDEPKLDEFTTPIIVGVIDTGIDWNHLDFSWDNLWRNEAEIPDNGIDDDGNGYIDDLIGWNFTGQNNTPWDYDGHGTFVAGIIAATQGNEAGIDGINGNAKIMVLKALNSFGRTRGSYIAEAIAYGADNGAHVLNLSVTGPGFPKIVQDAVDYARSKGVLVIVAAGNRAEEIASAKPAPLRGVLTVAATDRDDKRAPFSNVGLAVSVAAPGIDIVSLRARATDFMFNSADTPYQRQDAFLGEEARYYRSTGTSFSTPIVTGIASLVLAINPELTPAQLTRILKQSARDVEVPGIDRFTGYGVVDARAAVAADPEFFVHALLPLVRQVSVDDRGYLQVLGRADADQFAAARLELGQGADPQTWIPVGDPMTEPVRAAELGRIPAEQLAEASTWTIRLTVEHQNGRTREARYVVEVSE